MSEESVQCQDHHQEVVEDESLFCSLIISGVTAINIDVGDHLRHHLPDRHQIHLVLDPKIIRDHPNLKEDDDHPAPKDHLDHKKNSIIFQYIS